MTTGRIDNPSILLKPSPKLHSYIKNLTENLSNVRNGTSASDGRAPADHKYLLTDEDRNFLNGLGSEETIEASPISETRSQGGDDRLLDLADMHRLYDAIKTANEKTADEKVYFHELFDGSELVLPKNAETPRNPELEKRCELLKAQQQNVRYKAMTKNVDCVRQTHPEDTIAYQMKQLNRHLIAVGQFVVSVAAGFAFGFIGVELLVGNLDFGFRILLGIICALIIALAELYFLAKKLNEDLNYEAVVKDSNKSSKIN